MPRTHGRIMASIWGDPDFLALEAGPQRLYLFLLSQPDLSHAGLVPMRVRRWAKKVALATDCTIRADLGDLADARFIVADEDTEEVLIRTFVRNDGVYKQPKVMIRLRDDAKQIESPALRAVFRAELDRLPLDELSVNPTGVHGDGPSTRESVETVVNALREDFADAIGYPSEGVSDTPRVRGGGFPQPPTPSPLPPAPGHQEEPLADESADPELDRFEEFWDTYGNKVKRPDAERKWRLALKKPGVTPDLLISAAAAYVLHERHHNEGGRFIAHPSTWLHNERWRDERTVTAPAPSRFQQHMALVQQLADDEGQPMTSPFQIGPA